MQCKNCNAPLERENDRQIMFCPYCGTKLFIDESDTVKKQRIKSDTYRTVEQGWQYVEFEKYKRQYSLNIKKGIALASAIIFVLSFAFCLIFHPVRRFSNEFLPHDGQIQVTVSEVWYDGKNLDAAIEEFKAMGFTNIKTSHQISLLATVIRGFGDSVYHVSIDGDSEFIKGDCFDPDAVVVISYY